MRSRVCVCVCLCVCVCVCVCVHGVCMYAYMCVLQYAHKELVKKDIIAVVKNFNELDISRGQFCTYRAATAAKRCFIEHAKQ